MNISKSAATTMARVQRRSGVSSDKNDKAHPFQESSAQSYKPGNRSCQGCHRRKVRCDHGMPCGNCSKYGFTCLYPTKNSDAARRVPNLEGIANRLDRLESLLSRFAETSQVPTVSATVSATDGGIGNSGSKSQTEVQPQPSVDTHATASQHPSGQYPSKSTWELLLNDEQDIQYGDGINVGILQQDEVKTKNTQPTQSTGSETVPSLLHKNTISHHTICAQPGAWALSDMVSDVLEFYPDPHLALRLWTIYVKSVDPVLKILHIPTAQSAVVATILDPKCAGSSKVALTFAIYYAAITVLSHDDKGESIELPCEKPVLLKRYRMALDRLLTVSNFMIQPDMTALQALAIYVTCLRAHEAGRGVWVLNGLAIRLAQSMGLHQDAACLHLSHFETEMRLRLWWHLCVLDSRAPEDHGYRPTVDVINRGLRLPLNVNDNQIYPDMPSFPVESEGWTEMSFFLIQTESCRLLHPVLDQEQHSTDAILDINRKRKIMQEHGQYLSSKYSISSDAETSTDLSRIAMQHITTARKKMEFVLQLREEIIIQKQKKPQNHATPDMCKLSFKLACDGLESSYLLLKKGLASKFKWFFNTYTQWYALAYVLRCLCSSPYEFETERAWALVEALFPRESTHHGHSRGLDDVYGHGSIWKYLNLLRDQVSLLRQGNQLPVITHNVEIQFPSGGRIEESKLLPDIEAPPPTNMPATAHEASALPELNQEYISDASRDIFSSLDLSMPEIQFLPDWNAVINGCLNDGGHSSVL